MPWARIPRRARVLFGLGAALVIGVVLVAPVVFKNNPNGTCTRTLQYSGLRYTARPLPTFVQSVAIGTAVATGCGTTLENIDVRSVAGVDPAVALAVPTDDTSVYVHAGTCATVAAARLLTCLKQATNG